MVAIVSNTMQQLTRRREALGMSFAALAERSGVSEPTVKRIFAGRIGEASFAHVAAIASALGAPIGLVETDVDELCRRRARAKAEHIARLVQGTSALEGQGVDRETYNRLIERTCHELLAGPRRRLWTE